jgi:NAD-dependent SIR2 family protein deacetylase
MKGHRSQKPSDDDEERAIARAAEALNGARALVITAGAGMGVDSGLPDFRGPEGFWNAYPAYRHLGLGFMDLANPEWFEKDPAVAWGFYGHRLELYRGTRPHGGFAILRRWAEGMRDGAFVFTSNVDGHFERSDFDPDRIVECHGSLGWLQCLRTCGVGLFSAEGRRVAVDEATFRARSPFPACPQCGGLARPNILMFGDWAWDPSRTIAQEARLETWLRSLDASPTSGIVVVECGAGTGVPTVRMFGERLVRAANATLVRINLRESGGPAGVIAIPLGARDALERIEAQRSRPGDRTAARSRE